MHDFSNNTQKIRTQDLCQLGTKKGVDQAFERCSGKKNFFFLLQKTFFFATKKRNFSQNNVQNLVHFSFFFQLAKIPSIHKLRSMQKFNWKMTTIARFEKAVLFYFVLFFIFLKFTMVLFPNLK